METVLLFLLVATLGHAQPPNIVFRNGNDQTSLQGAIKPRAAAIMRSGLELAEHYLYPPRGYKVTRKRYTWAFRPMVWFLEGNSLEGDNHVLVLRSKG